MMASRGMGAIAPSKMPGAKRKARRDDTDFDMYAQGGLTSKGPTGPGNPGKVKNAGGPKGAGNVSGRYSTSTRPDLDAMYSQAQSTGDTETSRGIENEQDIRKRLSSGYAEGGEVWDKARPKGLGKPKKLSSSKKSSAKAMAAKAGRPYPNLIDNMRAARSK
jgi:hypothetical protein